MDDPKRVQTILSQARLIYDQAQIDEAIDRMATAITAEVKDDNPLLLSVLTGGVFTTVALALRLAFPLEIDYIHVSRYRGEIRPGDLHWRIEPRFPLKNRSIVIIDDILDGGLTMAAIADYCKKHHAKKVFTAVLLEKDRERTEAGLPKADFAGLPILDRYVFGFGLDYEESLRNMPGIYAVNP